jgi:hypothetical protein
MLAPMNLRFAAATAVILVGCGSAGGTGADGSGGATGTGGGGGEGGSMAAAGMGGGGGSDGVGGGATAGMGGAGGGSTLPPECAAGQATAEVFGHSASDLYRLDPNTLSVTHVGAFDCLSGDSMIDIAIDKTGTMYGTAFGGFRDDREDDRQVQVRRDG